MAQTTAVSLAGELPFGAIGRVLMVIERALQEGRAVTVELRLPRRMHPTVLDALNIQVDLANGEVRLLAHAASE